jgi:kumamolisin
VGARGTIAAIEAAFGTKLRMYQDKNGRFRAPISEPQLRDELLVVAGMGGLDDAAILRPHHTPPPPDANAHMGALGPADILKLYGGDLIPQWQGEGQSIAILGAGYPPSPTRDIDPFVKKYALPFERAKQYTQILLGGPNRDSDSLAQSEYFEGVLDIDMVMGAAPKASIINVTSATNLGMFETGIPFIVNNTPHVHTASISYGLCERYYAPWVGLFDFLFAQGKSQGQQWFVSSGDYGADGCGDLTDDAVLAADYPASSPWVVAVGGTMVEGVNHKEVVWNEGCEKCIAGGGQSMLYVKPDYQIGVGPYPDDGVRDLPDFSAVATDIAIIVQGQASSSGGTSASAPFMSGMFSRIDQALGGKGLRNVHERAYELGKAGIGWNDITEGTLTAITPGYDALPGYDLATGWGTPNLPVLIANWNN